MDNKLFELKSRLRGMVEPSDIYDVILSIMYLKKICKERNEQDFESALKQIKDENIKLFITELFDNYNSLVNIYNATDYDEKSAAEFIENISNDNYGPLMQENSTPKCLISLCKELLNIEENDDVLDFCSGDGDFLYRVAKNCNYKTLSGIEINTRSVAISKIKAYLTDTNYNVNQNDVFLVNDEKYSKIFSNYPFGMQVRYIHSSREVVEDLKARSYGNLISADWAFNYKICELLKGNGKAVVITTNGSLINNSEREVRDFFLKSSLIETVIALPEKLFRATSVPVNIIVFSKGWKDSVRFVDARNIFVKGRRTNDLSGENIKTILNLCKNDSKVSKKVPLVDIFKENSVLSPARYLEITDKKVENGIEFGSVIKSITRGAPLSGTDLDQIISSEKTDFQYLMLSNIKDGLIDDELPYLKTIDKKLEKYLIQDKNLVMSKNGYPFKTTVFEKRHNKVLANGNMFVIELDEQKVNPYYIKVFFDSEAGIAALKSVCAGSTIPNISQESLKSILIPNISLEEQQQIVNKYLAKKDEIEYLKRQLAKTLDGLNHIMD